MSEQDIADDQYRLEELLRLTQRENPDVTDFRDLVLVVMNILNRQKASHDR